MKATFKRILFASGIALASVVVASAADDKSNAAKEKAKTAEKADAQSNIDKAKEQFKQQSEAMLKDRQKLIDQLKNATEAERKSILEKMQQQQKEFVATMRELAKQQTDENRRLRESAGKPGGR